VFKKVVMALAHAPVNTQRNGPQHQRARVMCVLELHFDSTGFDSVGSRCRHWLRPRRIDDVQLYKLYSNAR
jgi:hypothetical protein